MRTVPCPWLPAALAALAVLAGLQAQQPSGSTVPVAPVVAEEPAPRFTVAIVGASVSAGFVDSVLAGGSADNETVPLVRVVKPWLEELDAAVVSRADLAMFLDPAGRGRKQVDNALKSQPSLVVGIDFLFWFGYGNVPKDALERAGSEAKARLALLETGLSLLGRFECPLVVGDFPDMSGASQRMLRASQVPGAATRGELNARVQQWVSGRPNVRLVGLAPMVTQMKLEGVALPLEAGELRVPPGGLLQGDRLHVNRLGMAWVGYQLQEFLLGQPRADAFPLPKLPRWTMDRFVAAAGAEPAVESLRAAATKR